MNSRDRFQIMISALMVVMLGMLGLRAEPAARPEKHRSVTLPHSHTLSAIQSRETAPFSRKIPQPIAPHLDLPPAHKLVAPLCSRAVGRVEAPAIRLGSTELEDFRERAPPAAIY